MGNRTNLSSLDRLLSYAASADIAADPLVTDLVDAVRSLRSRLEASVTLGSHAEKARDALQEALDLFYDGYEGDGSDTDLALAAKELLDTLRPTGGM